MNNNENVKFVAEQRENATPRKKRIKAIDVIAYIICLVVAFGIWSYVTSTENAEYEYQFTGVSVNLDGVSELKNKYNLLPISGYGTEVSITVKGHRSAVTKYTADDIYAYVDLSPVETADRYSLQIQFDLPDSMQLVSVEPSVINVFVDEIVEKQIPVEIDILYTSADNITVFEPVIEDDKIIDGRITVTGPKTVVESIDHALVVRDLGTITTGVVFNSRFSLIDDSGDEVTNPYVKTNVSDVSVSVNVLLEKTVALRADYVQSADDKYTYKVTWLYDGQIVENVRIVGDPKYVAKYDPVLNLTVKSIADYPNGSVPMPEDVSVYVGENKIRTISYTVTKELIDPQVS